mgnify:CR=1 FL=1
MTLFEMSVQATGEGRIVAASINFAKGGHLYGRYWGATQRHDMLHFELCYYRLIEHAIDHLVQTPGRQLQVAQSGKLEEIAKQVLQPRALLLDGVNLGHCAAFTRILRVLEILRQQIHVHPDHGQRILDFVMQPCSQRRPPNSTLFP